MQLCWGQSQIRAVQSIPMHHYPLWTVFSLDGKWAWVTNSEDNSVLKVQRGLGPREARAWTWPAPAAATNAARARSNRTGAAPQ